MHGLFILAFCLGLALRVTAMVAYRPVLLFSDSFVYLQHTVPFHLQWQRPGGYLAFLWPILHFGGSLYTVPVLQHLFGLGLAVACYAFLLRRGLPRWGATLAVLPLLLDPLQLVLEHYLLSDTLFELLLVGACLVVLWKPRPGAVAMLAAGVLVAAATLTRGAGTLLVVVFLVALVCLRVGWRRLVVFLLAVLIPVAGYTVEFHREYGQYAVTTAGARFVYARLAPIVHCGAVELPRYEEPLCPGGPVDQRKVINYYIWGHHRAPQWTVPPPRGMTQLQMVKDYDKRVVRSQPWVYARSVIGQFALGFAPTRTVGIGGNPASHWLFENHYWPLDDMIARGLQPRSNLQGTSDDPAAAAFLTGYRRWLWTPGPLMAALLLAGLIAASGVGRARRSGDRIAIGLLLASCLVPLVTGAAVAGFSWRYQLPQVPLLPVAGALAVAALARGRAPGREGADRPRAAAAAQPAMAVLAGVACGSASGAAAAWSGWAAAVPAGYGGAVVGALVTGMLLVARARAAADRRDA